VNESTIVAFRNPEAGVEDSLTELLCAGAQRLIQQAVEAEVGELLARYAGERDVAGQWA
jgi:hypothetical protein